MVLFEATDSEVRGFFIISAFYSDCFDLFCILFINANIQVLIIHFPQILINYFLICIKNAHFQSHRSLALMEKEKEIKMNEKDDRSEKWVSKNQTALFHRQSDKLVKSIQTTNPKSF